jgi:hypothetical protein
MRLDWYSIPALLLAALLVYSAIRKLSHDPAVVSSYARAGVPGKLLNPLAAVLLAGAAGLVAGLWLPALGLAASIGLTVYFALAIGAHIRHRDAVHLPVPVLMLVLSGGALILALARA